MDYKRFRENIKIARIAYSETIKGLSEKTGIKEGTIINIENGTIKPTLDNTIAICKGLNCKVIDMAEQMCVITAFNIIRNLKINNMEELKEKLHGISGETWIVSETEPIKLKDLDSIKFSDLIN